MGLGNQSRPHRADFDISTATTTEIVAAVTDKRIVVTNVVVIVGSSQTIKWQSGSDDISGDMAESYTTGDNELGVLETDLGAALNLVTGAAVAVAGHLTYVLMP